MGISSFIKSLVNKEAMGDEIIRIQEKAYHDAQNLYPDSDPHVLLAQVWSSRMAAHGKNIDNEAMQIASFTETMQFACVKPPDNIRALGLYIIYKERPDIIEQYPKFGLEFQKIMTSIVEAQQNDSVDALYKKYNPNMETEQMDMDSTPSENSIDSVNTQDKMPIVPKGHSFQDAIMIHCDNSMGIQQEYIILEEIFNKRQLSYEVIEQALLHKDGRDFDRITVALPDGSKEEFYFDITLYQKNLAAQLEENNGFTPLLMASQEGHIDIVRLLLEAKADVNKAGNNGTTPLLIASQEGHVDVVKLLLEAKADLSKAENDGFTPLLMAAQEGHADVVKLLLEAKADLNIKAEIKGKEYTALDLARMAGHTRIVTLLKEYGAKE